MTPTKRSRQLAPTADCLEGVYECLQTAERRVFDAHLDSPDAVALGQSVRHLATAVSLLADIVDRHITAPGVEARVDGR